MRPNKTLRSVLLLVGVLTLGALGVAAMREEQGNRALEHVHEGPREVPPVLLVHGMFGSPEAFQHLDPYLRARGAARTHAVTLRPVDGTASIIVLAQQLQEQADAFRAHTGARRMDVVGYSLGGIIVRYWLQRLGGRPYVRRFISISAPQHGVVGGYLSNRIVAQELRPGSPFLRSLDADPDLWGSVEAYDFWTPLDLAIVPAWSARLPGARLDRRFLVHTHHHMLTSHRVLRAVADTLLNDAPPVRAFDDDFPGDPGDLPGLSHPQTP